jgi:DHA2 family multidrug resistance protein
MSAPGDTIGRAAAAPPVTSATVTHHPALGVAAVLMGAFIATINSRVTTFALADIRGGMGLGFDEASWLTTVFSAAQMIIGPAAAWLATVFGVRRFLLWSGLIFALASFLLPFSRQYETVIALQFLRGMAVGTFIPSALGFILRSLPPRWWIWGLAAYSFRFVFSQNIAGSLEAYWGDAGQWEWIFWQNTALTPVMLALVWFGMPRDPVDRALLHQTDWGGIVFAGLGFGLIFIALDQGNRLDWLNSGVITGLLLAGGLLIAAFLVNEAVVARPLIHLRVAASTNVVVPALLISLYGFGTTATAFVLPDYLTRVQSLRALEIGHVLNWIALPQFLIVPLVVLLLRVIDARILLAVGFAMIGLGSWMDTGLTHDWVGRDFLDSQIVEAVGLAFAITALVTFAVANIVPAQAAAIAATIQTARLFGAELGSAFVQTFVRVREQVYSYLIGLPVATGTSSTERAIAQFSSPFADRAIGGGDPTGQGLSMMARLIQREAYVLAYIDGFWVIAWVSVAALLLLLLLKPPPPNPLIPSPRR